MARRPTLLERIRIGFTPRSKLPRPPDKTIVTEILVPLTLRRLLMNLTFLDGFKTYIIAAAMIVTAVSQLVGIDLPSFDGQSAGQLLMEGVAVFFLRQSVKKTGA
jgi:hypothetical protein